MVAARNKDVAFIVLMAGPGVPGDEIIIAQMVALAEAAGIPHEQVLQAEVRQRELLDLLMNGKDDTAFRQKLAELAGPQADANYREMTSPWYRYFLAYDPATALRKVSCPVLAINGDKDTEVPAKLNLTAIRTALEAGGNKRFETGRTTRPESPVPDRRYGRARANTRRSKRLSLHPPSTGSGPGSRASCPLIK